MAESLCELWCDKEGTVIGNLPRIGCLLSGLLLAADAGTAKAEKVLVFATPRAAALPGDTAHVQLKSGMAVPNVKLDPRRGTVVVRLTVKQPFGGSGQYLAVFPGPPRITVRCSAELVKAKEGAPVTENKLQAKAQIGLEISPDGNPAELIEAVKPLNLGQDLHLAWTWSGIKHRIFMNGSLVTEHIAASPFPRTIMPALLLLHDLVAKNAEAAPVHEIAVYDFPFSEAEAKRDYAEKDDLPLQPRETHGPAVVAQWAPGERKVHVTIDAGNSFSQMDRRTQITLQRGGKLLNRDQAELGSDGFGEALLPVPDMSAGRYTAEVALVDRAQRKPIAARSKPWDLPDTAWLGNTLGISDTIQPPWTPIQRNGLKLKVWGRDYDLAGGFGLPQQIVSQGRKLLARPVTLELMRNGQALPLTNPALQITNQQLHTVSWAGHADAGDVRVRIDGRLEYDGMMLLKLGLEPLQPGQKVKLDAVTLHTVLPKERALFLNTSTDQGYWWYTYKSWLPDEAGGSLNGQSAPTGVTRANKPTVLLDNSKQKAGKTPFLFFVLLCDHDVGLEWFADNLGGWQVDERRTLQEVIRETNGAVRLTCHLANRPFELAGPLTLTFGFDATPVKPLPPDWRSAYVRHHPLQNVPSDLTLWWLWAGPWSKFRPNSFALLPDDLEGFVKGMPHVPSVRYAPFTNQHVLLAAGKDKQRSDGGWPWLQNLLQAETDNDGWKAVPTRGARDYWAWNLDQWLKAKGMDAIYIDEANTQTLSARLLTGSGYVRPDGSHGFGHNTLAMRGQLKRVRQVLIDNGKRPLVWLPVYGMIIPHAHAFADVVSEGEAFMFNKPADPDWIDLWGRGLLERRGGPAVEGGPWLLVLGPAQKFGFVPIFLNYIKYYRDPQYVPAMRAQCGLLALLDIIPVDTTVSWFFKAKQDFGVAARDAAFHRFFDQNEIVSDRRDVCVSYYRRGDNLLLIVTNLGKEAYAGALKLDRRALGLISGELAATLIDGQKPGDNNTALKTALVPFEADGATLRVRIPSHDFCVISVGAR